MRYIIIEKEIPNKPLPKILLTMNYIFNFIPILSLNGLFLLKAIV